MRTALAYLNWGRWVADCPQPGCFDARAVYPTDLQTGAPLGIRNSEDVCKNGHPFRIQMPEPRDEAQIVAAVAERPVDADRSWYPKGHTRATLAGLPTGQSIKELTEEGAQVESFRSAEKEAERGRLRELLTGLGIQVHPDGRVEGSI